jgi:hypothetical protein
MSRRIDIELTSSRPDGSWTWRAAGARIPKGVLDGKILNSSNKVGDVVKADADFDIDGITILSVVAGKERVEKKERIEILPSDKPFQEVIETRAPRAERGAKFGDKKFGDKKFGDKKFGDKRGPRRDAKPGDKDREDRGPRRDGDSKSRSEGRPERKTSEGGTTERRRPSFTAPPEIPMRPRAKRLKPGRAHRSEILLTLPESQRTIAETVLQGGIPAVRAAVVEQNKLLKQEGKELIPADGLVTMAENLLPKLRVAEWLDRADAAVSDLDSLDLRDLRSVVTSGDDPVVARDETTRAVAQKLREGLVARLEKDQAEWLSDIDAAIGVGRVVRALKLSSQPPKAGARFPSDLGARLAQAASANLEADAPSDRWVAVLEAAAFSPVRAQIVAPGPPNAVTPELATAITRLAAAIPQIAKLFGIVVAPGAAMPRPLRPARPVDKKKPTRDASRPAPAKKTEPAAEIVAEPVAEPTIDVAEPAIEVVEQPAAAE